MGILLITLAHEERLEGEYRDKKYERQIEKRIFTQ